MDKPFSLSLLAILLLVFVELVSCAAPPSPTPTPIFALPTQGILILPTDSPSTTPLAPNPTDSAATPAASTPTASVATPSANVTSAPAPTLAAGNITVKIFLVALNDNGKSGKKIGCNDSVVGVDRQIPATQGVLAAALNELLSLHERNYGQSGLYNALYQATLKLEEVTLINGRANIALTGKPTRGGVCDDPRIKYQIEETALQFATVRSVAVTINGIPIDKALSEK